MCVRDTQDTRRIEFLYNPARQSLSKQAWNFSRSFSCWGLHLNASLRKDCIHFRRFVTTPSCEAHISERQASHSPPNRSDPSLSKLIPSPTSCDAGIWTDSTREMASMGMVKGVKEGWLRSQLFSPLCHLSGFAQQRFGRERKIVDCTRRAFGA